VTLYEMLTGSVPFTAADPMEWVHCHVARQPTPPSERMKQIPAPLSAMTMKLLAKTAEERYQTAAGLEHDLRRCLAQLEVDGRIDDFTLAEHDTPDRLLIPEKLYGREREIETLLAAFERIVEGGAPELVLVPRSSSWRDESPPTLVQGRAALCSRNPHLRRTWSKSTQRRPSSAVSFVISRSPVQIRASAPFDLARHPVEVRRRDSSASEAIGLGTWRGATGDTLPLEIRRVQRLPLQVTRVVGPPSPWSWRDQEDVERPGQRFFSRPLEVD
jgi:serine/threonine protein kinase